MADDPAVRLTWYSGIAPAKTVEIVNYMKTHAEAGGRIFYNICTDEEKAADPVKKDMGLFFFKGTPGERFAICNAGGDAAGARMRASGVGAGVPSHFPFVLKCAGYKIIFLCENTGRLFHDFRK